MHGLSSTSTAFVSTSPVGINEKRGSLTPNGQRFHVQPAAMMAGYESEIYGFAKDMATAAATGATGDLIAQFAEKKRNEDAFQFELEDDNPVAPSFGLEASDFDLRRTAAYGSFAACYTGAFQHFLFGTLHERISDPIGRLAINQGLIIPLCYYSLLVWLVPKLRARSPEEVDQLRSNINVLKMIPRNWAFWLPLQFIQFSYIPTDYQVIYCSFCGLLWTIVLSFLTAGGQPKVPQPTMAELNLDPAAESRISSAPEFEKAFETLSSASSFAFTGPSNSTSYESNTIRRR